MVMTFAENERNRLAFLAVVYFNRNSLSYLLTA